MIAVLRVADINCKYSIMNLMRISWGNLQVKGNFVFMWLLLNIVHGVYIG